MTYEVHFLPVGEGERSGDAVALRWFDEGRWHVLVYDGGTAAAGESLVAHVRAAFGTNRVDYLVNSHPDGDHACGLAVVLEEMDVGEVWMHLPWKHSAVIRQYFADGRITNRSLEERLRTKMAAAHRVAELADQKRIRVFEPFAGDVIGGRFFVLGPLEHWYVHDLLQAFEKTPQQKISATSYAQMGLATMYERSAHSNGLLGRPSGIGNVAVAPEPALMAALGLSDARSSRPVTSMAAGGLLGLAMMSQAAVESWTSETLRDNVETSAENESSVVLLGHMGAGKSLLLTGDAGVNALKGAADYYDEQYASIFGALPELLKVVQVPHHGSRHNVSSGVLNRILGPRKAANDGLQSKVAFASVGAGSKTHPRQEVVNAFLRRGARVLATKGMTVGYHEGIPLRTGWDPVPSLEFSTKVDPWP